jgi:subtilisin family serine protease
LARFSKPSILLSMFVAAASAGAVTLFAQNIGGFRVDSLPESTGRPARAISKALLQRERDAAARGEPRRVSVIVRLSGEPLASYEGTIPGLAATNPRATGTPRLNPRSISSERYLRHLEGRRANFKAGLRAAIPAARVQHEYQAILNGISLVLPETEISALAALPGVEGVYEDELLAPDTDTSPGFIGAPQLWNQLGGQHSAGEHVVVGVLDTGVWPEHPSYADPDPSGKSYAPRSGAALPCTFGSSVPGDAAFTCNNKLIGARAFLATYNAVVGRLPNEFPTARDDNGHGTHTSTTAAGNAGVQSAIFNRTFGAVSGIAPRAKIIAYKVCLDQGCFSSDAVAAVNQAILDGVDVINFSIAGGSNPYGDAVSLAFLDAYNAGVFVAASSGNSGPGANTTEHREPWTMTVGGSTINRQFQSTVTLTAADGASLTLRGASVTPGVSSLLPVTVPAPANDLCQQAFPASSLTGQIVVCKRGVNARVEKSFNAAAGGAAGMILYNPTRQGISTDNHFVPSVHLENTEGAALVAFLAAHPGSRARFTAGAAVPAQGDVMADFSSRGGPGLTLGIGKPDITAPGVQILAGASPLPATVVGGARGQLFQAIQGTSMSSPHIAGAAALLAALHPTWTPGEIKSALMTTAVASVVKEDGVTPADAFDFGSGRVDLSRAADPGFLFDESGANFVALQSHLWDANYPSLFVPAFLGELSVERVLHSTRRRQVPWRIEVSAPPDLIIDVPRKVTVPAFGAAPLRIGLAGHNIPLGGVRHALLEFRHGNETTLRFPITVVRAVSQVPLTKVCAPLTIAQGTNTNCTISVTNTTFNAASVFITDTVTQRSLRLVTGSVTNAAETEDGLTFNGVLGAAQPPDVTIGPGTSPGGGYLPLANFGVPPVGNVTDDTIINFNVPEFLYAGEVYTRVGFASNGYVVVGGGSGPDISVNNQNFPNPARPNNVLAPFWTDLDPAAAGTLRIGTLTDGFDTWIILDWQAVREFTLPRLASFQVWIGVRADAHPGEDISFAYGPIQGNGDGGFLSVGVENRFGNRGQNVYFNGTGTLPANGTQLRVASTPAAPGETRVITFAATGQKKGPWTNCARMTSPAFFGTQTACANGTTIKGIGNRDGEGDRDGRDGEERR